MVEYLTVEEIVAIHDEIIKETFGIITSHPFIDGNKRTAISSTETFMRENGHEFIANDEELWDIVHKISEGKLKFRKVVFWIKDRIK